MQEFLESFRDPPNRCRVMPFWFWNSKLDNAEIITQIRAFKEMGLGGFFIHARFGLETPYMSIEWMDAVEAAVCEAKEQGLEVWLYDENLFPSGIGDTTISRQPKFRSKFIEYGNFELLHDDMGYYVPLNALPEGCELFSAQAVSDDSQLILTFEVRHEKIRIGSSSRHSIALFWVSTIHNANDMFFGVDYCNPETTKAFIDSTHEVYKRRLGKWFGTVIKGFFTDEPTLLPWHHDISWYKSRGNGMCVPYTPGLIDEMKRDGAEGIDLCRLAGALFFDCGCADHTGVLRKSYWETVSRLYEENFFKAYAAWCEDNALMLTGHVLLEEGLYFNHIFQAGPLTGLEHLHMPGVDQLSAYAERSSMSYMVEDLPHIPTVKTNVTGPKLVSSIAHLSGRRQVISESFGLGGWALQFRDMKAILDWEYVLGVNRLCPHAFFYSIEGYRKGDAPPCHFHNSNAPLYKLFADYAARMSWALSQGMPAADTAVIYPESAFRQCYAAGRQRERDSMISDAYDLVCTGLLSLQRGFEIITERQLASSVLEQGEITVAEDRVGSEIPGVPCEKGGLRFSSVIAPSLAGMGSAATEMLDRFVASGGKLLALNEESTTAVSVGNGARCGVQEKNGMTRTEVKGILWDFFGRKSPKGIRILGKGRSHVYTICRMIMGGVLWLIANTDTAHPFVGRLSFDARKAFILDAETGKHFVRDQEDTGLQLAPAASMLVFVPENADVLPEGTPYKMKVFAEGTVVNSEGWAFSTAGFNSLPVSKWNLSIERKGMTTEYTYSASVYSNTIAQNLMIVLDDIGFRSAIMGELDISVSFNGSECDPAGWYIDKGFKQFKVDRLKKGSNELKVVIRHAAWSGEPCLLTSSAVLLGRFGLEKLGCEWIIVSEPGEIRLDAWNSQGYPFYSGQAVYRKKVTLPDSEKTVLELESVDGCARLFIDGEDTGARLWAPWKWEIPEKKAGKEVELTLVVTNTLANYLGEECRSGPKGRMWIRQYI